MWLDSCNGQILLILQSNWDRIGSAVHQLKDCRPDCDFFLALANQAGKISHLMKPGSS